MEIVQAKCYQWGVALCYFSEINTWYMGQKSIGFHYKTTPFAKSTRSSIFIIIFSLNLNKYGQFEIGITHTHLYIAIVMNRKK